MKPRGIKGLLSKQTSNFPPSATPPAPESGGINWNAAPAESGPGSEKRDKGKTARGKGGDRGPSAKQSSGGSKNSASVPRRTAPGA